MRALITGSPVCPRLSEFAGRSVRSRVADRAWEALIFATEGGHLAECSFVIYALKLLIEMEGIYSEYLICIMPLFAEAGD